MFSLLEHTNNNKLSVFFLGSPESLLKRVLKKCENTYPNINILGSQHGYYNLADEKKIVSKIASIKPDILFVAFGSPRKEEFINKYKNILNAKVAIAVGGSYEVLVGDKKRGNPLIQKLGLEWFMRLIQDPQRLWKRYLITNTMFMVYLIKRLLGLR